MKHGIVRWVVGGLVWLAAPWSYAANLPCLATASPPTFTENNIAPCSTDLSGNTRVGPGAYWAGENATARALVQVYTSESGIPIRYTTTGDKSVKTASAGEVVRILASAGTSVTATIWDTSNGSCNTGTQLTGPFPLTAGQSVTIGTRHASGICITLGGTSPDVTVEYR